MKNHAYRVTVLGTDGVPVFTVEEKAANEPDAMEKFQWRVKDAGMVWTVDHRETIIELFVTAAKREA